jgi:hypothetical protein
MGSDETDASAGHLAVEGSRAADAEMTLHWGMGRAVNDVTYVIGVCWPAASLPALHETDPSCDSQPHINRMAHTCQCIWFNGHILA